jgi:hypothetical protein
MGQLVKTIIDNEFKNAGSHEFRVSMDDFASGIYLVSLTQGSQKATKKIILLK